MDSFLHQVWHASLQLVVFAAVFIALERVFMQRRETILRRQFLNDLGYYFLNTLTLSSLIALPMAALAVTAQRLVPEALIAQTAALPLWARVLLVLVIGDIGAYWGHRWCHRFRLLWRFHAIHHSSEHVDWLVNTRAHPFELVFTRLCGLTPLFALGLAQSTQGLMPAFLLSFGSIWGFVIHANVRWRFGWLEYAIATPAFHHWHHTNDDKRDHNYAALFPAVDWMFGTLHLPRSYPAVYGVDHPPATSLLGQLVDPLLPEQKKTEGSQPS